MLSLEFKLAWGENCTKNRKIRAKVDSRIYGRWRLRVMGSCRKGISPRQHQMKVLKMKPRGFSAKPRLPGILPKSLEY